VWTEIEAQISQAIGNQFEIVDRRSIGGGCINQAYAIDNGRDRYFIKLNQPALVEMFAAEARGLSEIAATNTIKVPNPICWGSTDRHSYLVLEYLDLTTKTNALNWQQMGRDLAALHLNRITNDGCYGWHLNNTIGSTPQINIWETNWADFFTNHRIGYQLKLARRHGGTFDKGDRLLAAMPTLLGEYRSVPSLVHGDLWGGNASFTRDGMPVIFDPATYWGDREVDIAMTELFGGFPADFYRGYNEIYPLDSGYSQRKDLYNLYHILNHFNLFGGSYYTQAERTIEALLERANN
jgi:fructosamine-3-kinase